VGVEAAARDQVFVGLDRQPLSGESEQVDQAGHAQAVRDVLLFAVDEYLHGSEVESAYGGGKGFAKAK